MPVTIDQHERVRRYVRSCLGDRDDAPKLDDADAQV